MEPIRLGALLPGSVLVGDGINRAQRGVARTARGDVPAIVKIVPPRELAVELLCAALGRHLGLPVPEPLLISVPGAGLAFGSADAGHPSLRHLLANDADVRVLERLQNWTKLESAASFDDLIANPDRHIGNVLYDGEGQFWLIDHGLALAFGMSPATAVNNILLGIARNGRDELALQRLKRTMLDLAGTYRKDDIESAAERVPALPCVAELVDFLVARLTHLSGIARQRLRTRQQDLDYGG